MFHVSFFCHLQRIVIISNSFYITIRVSTTCKKKETNGEIDNGEKKKCHRR